MIGRTGSKRLERLETRMMPAGEPLVYEIQFVSAVDGSITRAFSRFDNPTHCFYSTERRFRPFLLL
jgi:hypothetical protein